MAAIWGYHVRGDILKEMMVDEIAFCFRVYSRLIEEFLRQKWPRRATLSSPTLASPTRGDCSSVELRQHNIDMEKRAKDLLKRRARLLDDLRDVELRLQAGSRRTVADRLVRSCIALAKWGGKGGGKKTSK